ncbi:hypothetical protein BARBAKC583_1283 [Bartonella bacilliformis KC583]|uniref:Uncharacterized protein n=1 Tax=Bartonella bacilliformis (strain ATCC 35685 / KC583 / Herrer 020/F12,63) TaxID=360095 RepID=A1UU79_BARBK|nr:hypothetical protein BARBAKC583_1283 [Bartonella bacilliformis KC583]
MLYRIILRTILDTIAQKICFLLYNTIRITETKERISNP